MSSERKELVRQAFMFLLLSTISILGIMLGIFLISTGIGFTLNIFNIFLISIGIFIIVVIVVFLISGKGEEI